MFAMASSSPHLSSFSSSLLTSHHYYDGTLVTPTPSRPTRPSSSPVYPPTPLTSAPPPAPPLPPLLLLPDTLGSSLTSSQELLYTTGQADLLADLLGLGQGVKEDLLDNQD